MQEVFFTFLFLKLQLLNKGFYKLTDVTPIEILLVEDNSGDLFLTKRAFSKAKIANNISVAQDGDAAMDMLHKKGVYKNTPRPDIILLDINLPKKSGQEVLAEIKADESLKTIPVIILSSSEAQEDIVKSYKLNASGYITKPIDLPQFHDIVSAVENFWFSIVRLPKE